MNQPREQDPSGAEASGGPIRIWLVEDDAHYRETVAYLVNHTSGMRCTQVFADGEAALALSEAEAEGGPDVLLLDINLPGLSGIDLIGHLKARWPEAQIVMLTNHDDDSMIFEAFAAGASGYLFKNAPVDKITAAIREARSGGMLMPAPVARKVQRFFMRQSTPRPDYGLSEREREVLERMVEGLSQKEIAAALFVSPSTVNGHIQRIYQKLHVHSSSAAVAKAIRERLV